MEISTPQMHYSLYTLQYPTLCKVLNEEDQKDQERDWGDLDLLKENMSKNLEEIFKKTDTIVIEIDHDKKEISLIGEPLPGEFEIIAPMNNESKQEQVYNHFLGAISQAKELGRFEEIFKELEK